MNQNPTTFIKRKVTQAKIFMTSLHFDIIVMVFHTFYTAKLFLDDGIS